MRTSDMIKSNYISKAEVKAAGQMILTIVDCSLEKVGADEKWVLWFNEHPKGLGLNNTKIRILEASYGEESSLWNGRRIRLTYDPTVTMAGQVTGGIKLSVSTQAGPQRTNGVHGHALAAPAGAPPPPIWDGSKWVVQAPPQPAGAAFDAATGEVFAEPQPARHQRPQTISERVNAEHPPAAGYMDMPPPASPSEFDDDIPF